MRVIITESQLSELVLDLQSDMLHDENAGGYYKPEFQIFPHGYGTYLVGKDIKHMVGMYNMHMREGGESLEAAFRMLNKKDHRDWFRIVSMLPMVYMDFIKKSGVEPRTIPIWGPRVKRYQSSQFINYMMKYFGDKYRWERMEDGIVLIKKEEEV